MIRLDASQPCRRLYRIAMTTAFVLPFILLAAPATAADSRWSLHAYGLQLEPTGDANSFERAPARTLTQVVDEGATGFGAELELRWTRHVSLAAGAFFFDLDSVVTVDDGAAISREAQSFGVYAPYLGADWHLTPESRVDVRLGVFGAQLNYEDVIFFHNTANREVLRYDDDFGLGLRVGVDWAWQPDGQWSLRADLRYLGALLESENAGEDLDLDPLILTAGVTFRW